jgi:hypothetical protein
MLGVALDLPTRTGRELILKKVFKKYPTDYDPIGETWGATEEAPGGFI